jgi:hypothetical protein
MDSRFRRDFKEPDNFSSEGSAVYVTGLDSEIFSVMESVPLLLCKIEYGE